MLSFTPLSVQLVKVKRKANNLKQKNAFYVLLMFKNIPDIFDRKFKKDYHTRMLIFWLRIFWTQLVIK